MKLISQTKAGKLVTACLIYRPDGTMVAKIHTHFSAHCFQVDVYGEDNEVLFQNRVKSADLSTVIGATGDQSGAVIDGVQLYRNVVRIKRDDPSLIRDKETQYYLAGLDRLRAKGYKILKVI
jgi:hypothetical protein